MSFESATATLAAALKVAEKQNDSAQEHLIAGLLDLTQTLADEVAAIKHSLSIIDSDIKNVR